MLIHIPQLLSLEHVNECRQHLTQAIWIDGKTTTGLQSSFMKHNLQLDEQDEVALKLSPTIAQAALAHPMLFSAALPKEIYPPLFNCYQGGGHFGMHVDNAIRQHPQDRHPIRTDVSCTVFLTNPDEYEGGELIIEDTFGQQSIKLVAGDAIVYPSTSIHQVRPVTKGVRIAAFFWIQSFIASDEKRRILFELDQNIQKLTVELSHHHPQVISLTGIYHNLLRQWSH